MQATGRDIKKLADKERRQMEEAHRAKAAALRDDDNVFDVAYEQQGGEGQDVLSATDIKVSTPQSRDKSHWVPGDCAYPVCRNSLRRSA